MNEFELNKYVKDIAIEFVSVIELNYSLVFCSTGFAWVDKNKNKILVNGSDYHYKKLVDNHGKTLEQIYNDFINVYNYNKI